MGEFEAPPVFGSGPYYPSDGLSRLDHATKLVREDRRLWLLRLYPDAAEAGGAWVWVGRQVGPRERLVPDPERARSEADRRARGKLRRYVASNRLNRLITLTYAGEGLHDPVRLRGDVGLFVRRLRRETGGQAFPYAWVPEWHKSGHGLHLHVAVGGYIHKPVIEESWGHGFVDVRLLRGRWVRGTLAEARAAAGYLAKYLGKGFEDNRGRGLHRYEVAQGFQPASVEIAGRSMQEALVQANSLMPGFQMSRLWESRLEESWQGPPAVWVAWVER